MPGRERRKPEARSAKRVLGHQGERAEDRLSANQVRTTWQHRNTPECKSCFARALRRVHVFAGSSQVRSLSSALALQLVTGRGLDKLRMTQNCGSDYDFRLNIRLLEIVATAAFPFSVSCTSLLDVRVADRRKRHAPSSSADLLGARAVLSDQSLIRNRSLMAYAARNNATIGLHAKQRGSFQAGGEQS